MAGAQIRAAIFDLDLEERLVLSGFSRMSGGNCSPRGWIVARPSSSASSSRIGNMDDPLVYPRRTSPTDPHQFRTDGAPGKRLPVLPDLFQMPVTNFWNALEA